MARPRLLLIGAIMAMAGLNPMAADVVDDTLHSVMRALQGQNTAPPEASRKLAIITAAAADTAARFAGRREPVLVRGPVEPMADAVLAAGAAAHRAAAALIPVYAAEFDQVWTAACRGSDPAVIAASERMGAAAAETWLEARANDGSNTTFPYVPTNAPGAWRRTPPFHRPPESPHWRFVKPFALTNAAQFRPPGPPPLGSERYLAELAETRRLGAAESPDRTPDQTAAAQFWNCFIGSITPPGHWNLVALNLAAERHLDVGEKTALLALLNCAMADSAIACWDCKFHYNFWRPVTVIRSREAKGVNPKQDPAWRPLLPTPAFPEYVSGHSTFSGAAAEVLQRYFGRDDIAFTASVDGVERHFTGFSASAREAGMSRIWGGIHFRSANEDGMRLGRQVGGFAYDRLWLATGAAHADRR